jgi:transcriptional regulator with XRE-family HTH domain
MTAPPRDEDEAEAIRLLVAYGEDIREARLLRGMTQEQLAAAVGLGQPYVSKIELGARKPSLRLKIRIARAVGLRVVLSTRRLA